MPGPVSMFRFGGRKYQAPFAGLFQTGDMWFDAGNVTTSGANVTEFIDRNDATNLFAQASQPTWRVTLNAADSGFNNQPTTTSVASNVYVSNKTAASGFWRFTHDGTGFELFFVGSVSDITSQYNELLYSSWQTGLDTAILNGPNFYFFVNNGGSGVVGQQSTAHAVTINTPTYFNYSYGSSASPNWFWRTKSSLQGSGAQAIAPTTANPSGDMFLFSDMTGAYKGKFAALYVFKRRLADAERTLVQDYIQTTYGIAP